MERAGRGECSGIMVNAYTDSTQKTIAEPLSSLCIMLKLSVAMRRDPQGH